MLVLVLLLVVPVLLLLMLLLMLLLLLLAFSLIVCWLERRNTPGANMCGACLRDQVDVTEDIPKKGLVIIQVGTRLSSLSANDTSISGFNRTVVSSTVGASVVKNKF